MLDATDEKIIACLKENGRAQWKDIGKQVHLTGQAVADRVHRLEDLGIIEGYTATVNDAKAAGNSIIAFITVFMSTTKHDEFQQFIRTRPEITEACRISGEGCYWLKTHFSSNTMLNSFLDQLLPFGNYRLNLSINKIK
jgi:Lrp/AsnC family leucine-responsive transcriptional regulator